MATFKRGFQGRYFMKNTWIAMLLVVVFGCAVGANAADDSKKTDKKTEKKEEKKDMKAAHEDGSTVTITGMMAVKSQDAKSDVVCRLTTGNQKMDKVYNLVATGELATKIQSMR